MSHRKAKSESQKTAVPQIGSNPLSERSATSKFADNRPEAVAQRKLQEMANKSPQVEQTGQSQDMANAFSSVAPVQKKNNNTGLPDQLKSGIENLSGYSMDDVKVHRNSDKPAQLNAHAFAQGTEIHLASGQEKHLPHEAWHVVQQKQGRVKPTVQMKNNPSAKAKKGVNINDDPGLEKEADIMGAKAAQNSEEKTSGNTLQKKKLKTTASPGQLKKKTDLTPGVLNMIGESHNDYPNKNARAYDATKIKEKLGQGVKYYQEGSLKTKKSNKDFSDPVDLRVEQIISFTQEHCTRLVPKLKAINLSKLDLEISEIEEGKEAVAETVKELTPSIMSEDFDEDIVIEAIKSKNFSIDKLEILSKVKTWNTEIVDPDDKYEENFDAVSDALDMVIFQKQKELSSQGSLVFASSEIDTGKRILMNEMDNFYESFNLRLPTILKVYLHLKHERHYANSANHFEFDVAKIPGVLAAWKEIRLLLDHIRTVYRTGDGKLLKAAILQALEVLNELLKALDSGMAEGKKNRHEDDVRQHRSEAMHHAAQTLHGKNIAWKVGDFHVDDIFGMEEMGIIETDYAYITKQDFAAKYYDKTEMQSFTGSHDVLKEQEEREVEDRAIYSSADQILADPEKMKIAMSNEPNWDAIFGSIEHLDLSNLITNATGIIVDAILKGKIPKLKSISISKQSMTPDLNGKLIGHGIEVNLV
ncbi:MAG: DUF4157 domain-containing protein [Bacteroidota bacterium]